MPQPQPSDVGFGYIASPTGASFHRTSVNGGPSAAQAVEMPPTPASPLKSAMKMPGTPGRLNPLSPTFKEEQYLEEKEAETEKENAHDVKVKTRVRMAKMALRGTNFSCSLIVMSMLATTFQVFNNSQGLAQRGNLPTWAQGTQTWPQIVLMVISCVSLVTAVIVLAAYCRGGHRRATRAAVYYTWFAIAFFTFNTVMWIVGAVVLNESKRQGKGNDVWGWSCKQGKRESLFQDDVDYALVCRLQSWSLICAVIEITVEVITITIYLVVFYRYRSKRRLHKSMDIRDKARSDLYLAQLRVQSAPNTPGFAKTPISPTGKFPHRHGSDASSRSSTSRREDMNEKDLENGDGVQTQYATASPSSAFSLQAAPFKSRQPQTPVKIQIQAATPAIGSTPADDQTGHFAAFVPPNALQQHPVTAHVPTDNEHVPAAPGEEVYESVPVPGSYEERNTHVPAAPGEEVYGNVPVPGGYGGAVGDGNYVHGHAGHAGQQQEEETYGEVPVPGVWGGVGEAR